MRTGKNFWNHKLLIIISILSWVACQGRASGESEETDQAATEWNNPEKDFQVTCLVYHRFGDSRYPSTNTPEAAFENHLKYLKDQGFTSYTVSGLLNDTAALFGQQKKILITVDDGFASFVEKGVPLLEKYDMKATLFVNTESVGWSDFLNWQQLKELMDKGIEIGCHSHKHAFFVNLPDAERPQTFEKDLLRAESLFQEHLGFVPKVYVYPYGEFLPNMIEVLKKHGYRIAFAQNSGVLSNKTHPYAVPRFPVAGHHIGMEQFAEKVNMGPLKVGTAGQLPIIVKAGQELSFSITLTDKTLTGPFNCFVAGQPRPDALTKERDTLTLNVKVPPNRRRTLVTLTTRNKEGKWLWYSRVLINPQVTE